VYLLHGCCDDYLSWTRSTDVEALSRASDVLVVMPDGGDVGFYSDWLNGPGWETFHSVELPALLSARYRAGDRQAVAGVSMGGLDYAAHHPGRYTAAASFSGIVHTRLSEDVTQDYRGLLRSRGVDDPDALWGNPYGDVDTWMRHNPYDLAGALRGTSLFVSAGDGRAGPLDPPEAASAPLDGIETSIDAQNRAFVDRLHALDIPVQAGLYTPGTHNWVYWQRELHRAWPLLTAGLTS
jgi:diacylglycerol O-acyltransferase / trehalose O-mycolyltransferase